MRREVIRPGNGGPPFTVYWCEYDNNHRLQALKTVGLFWDWSGRIWIPYRSSQFWVREKVHFTGILSSFHVFNQSLYDFLYSFIKRLLKSLLYKLYKLKAIQNKDICTCTSMRIRNFRFFADNNLFTCTQYSFRHEAI